MSIRDLQLPSPFVSHTWLRMRGVWNSRWFIGQLHLYRFQINGSIGKSHCQPAYISKCVGWIRYKHKALLNSPMEIFFLFVQMCTIIASWLGWRQLTHILYTKTTSTHWSPSGVRSATVCGQSVAYMHNIYWVDTKHNHTNTLKYIGSRMPCHVLPYLHVLGRKSLLVCISAWLLCRLLDLCMCSRMCVKNKCV